ncbi:MAG: hypothetical protein FWC00_02495 [Firmicutes bacterium]|nr:hypothetical protein [Bacillota bacterium]
MAKNKFRIIVNGGTNNKNYSAQEKAQCEKLGEYLGSIGAEVKTGGCGGYPYFVGKKAVETGARVWGQSPALNEKEHLEKFGYPIDGVTDMIYAKPQKFANKAESFLLRMQEMQPFADVVVCLGGSWGTYYECQLAFWYKKIILVVEEFGGACEAFLNTYDFFASRDTLASVHEGAKIIRCKTVDDAIKEIVQLNT